MNTQTHQATHTPVNLIKQNLDLRMLLGALAEAVLSNSILESMQIGDLARRCENLLAEKVA